LRDVVWYKFAELWYLPAGPHGVAIQNTNVGVRSPYLVQRLRMFEMRVFRIIFGNNKAWTKLHDEGL
jgi:hypothetical protein